MVLVVNRSALSFLSFVATLGILALPVSGCSPDEPGAPSDLSAESRDGAVAANWDASEGDVSGYNIYRSESSFEGTAAEKVNGSLVEGASYVDQEVQNRTTYHYRVTAVTESGDLLGIGGGSAESDPSNEVEKTPFSSPPDRP